MHNIEIIIVTIPKAPNAPGAVSSATQFDTP